MTKFPYWVHKHSCANVLNCDKDCRSDEDCSSDEYDQHRLKVRRWFLKHQIMN